MQEDMHNWPSTCGRRTHDRNPIASDILRAAIEAIDGNMIVTKQNIQHSWNAALNGQLRVMASSANDIAPPEKFSRCAIVGNSGHLLNSEYGAAIDSHDAVLRTNQAPVKGCVEPLPPLLPTLSLPTWLLPAPRNNNKYLSL